MQTLDYAAPTDPRSAAERRGRKHVRAAVALALSAGVLWALWFVLTGIRRRDWEGEFGGFFVFEAVVAVMALAVGSAGWWVAPALFGGAFDLLHLLFGSGTTRREWNDAAFNALWRLPWATAAGLLLLTAYGAVGSGGWGDVVYGLIANAVGAWVYVPILCRWWMLDRDV